MQGNLFSQQKRNRRRSVILVTLFLFFFAWIGFGGDYALYLMTGEASPDRYRHAFPWIGLAAVTIGTALAVYGWKNGYKEVLWAAGAWKMLAPIRHEEEVLVNVVEEMAIASGLPRPTIWIIPDTDPNAFAAGTDQRRAHIAVTEGLLTALNREQLQAVIAHEMAHIRNEDVRLMTLLSALMGVIVLLSDGARNFLRRGGYFFGRRGGGGSKRSAGHLGLLVFILWLLTLMIAPIISRLLALGVSRKREFLADAVAAQFTRNPMALAEALEKIDRHHSPTVAIRPGSAHLCIADPLGRPVTNRSGLFADLFATHPPMFQRISRLKAMAYRRQKREAAR
jgi:heat shock protein HtpX